MGSSTRNSYQRSQKVIEQGISENKVSQTGEGIAKLLAKLLFPKNGVSKVRTVLQENIYSNECTNSIKQIIRVSKAVQTGSLTSIVFGGIGGLSNIEVNERICEFVGVSDNELLKISFKETLNKVDILDKASDTIQFISEYVKNIISNVFKQFTYEDTLNALENFDTQKYSDSIDEYMEVEIVPIVALEMNELVLEEETDDFPTKIKNTLSRILEKIRRKKE